MLLNYAYICGQTIVHRISKLKTLSVYISFETNSLAHIVITNAHLTTQRKFCVLFSWCTTIVHQWGLQCNQLRKHVIEKKIIRARSAFPKPGVREHVSKDPRNPLNVKDEIICFFFILKGSVTVLDDFDTDTVWKIITYHI